MVCSVTGTAYVQGVVVCVGVVITIFAGVVWLSSGGCDVGGRAVLARVVEGFFE